MGNLSSVEYPRHLPSNSIDMHLNDKHCGHQISAHLLKKNVQITDILKFVLTNLHRTDVLQAMLRSEGDLKEALIAPFQESSDPSSLSDSPPSLADLLQDNAVGKKGQVDLEIHAVLNQIRSLFPTSSPHLEHIQTVLAIFRSLEPLMDKERRDMGETFDPLPPSSPSYTSNQHPELLALTSLVHGGLDLIDAFPQLVPNFTERSDRELLIAPLQMVFRDLLELRTLSLYDSWSPRKHAPECPAPLKRRKKIRRRKKKEEDKKEEEEEEEKEKEEEEEEWEEVIEDCRLESNDEKTASRSLILDSKPWSVSSSGSHKFLTLFLREATDISSLTVYWTDPNNPSSDIQPPKSYSLYVQFEGEEDFTSISEQPFKGEEELKRFQGRADFRYLIPPQLLSAKARKDDEDDEENTSSKRKITAAKLAFQATTISSNTSITLYFFGAMMRDSTAKTANVLPTLRHISIAMEKLLTIGFTRDAAIASMISMAKATGSLELLLNLCSFLKSLPPSIELESASKKQVYQLMTHLHRELVDRRKKRLSAKQEAPSYDHVGFSTTNKSANSQIVGGGNTVTMTDWGSGGAALDITMNSGIWEWEIVLIKEVDNDQAACIGVTQLPNTSFNYDSDPNMWIIRCYNGQLYHSGAQSTTLGAIAAGSTVTFTMDCDAGTLTMQYAGNTHVLWTDIPANIDLAPCICFYSNQREAKLQNLTQLTMGSDEQESSVSEEDIQAMLEDIPSLPKLSKTEKEQFKTFINSQKDTEEEFDYVDEEEEEEEEEKKEQEQEEQEEEKQEQEEEEKQEQEQEKQEDDDDGEDNSKLLASPTWVANRLFAYLGLYANEISLSSYKKTASASLELPFVVNPTQSTYQWLLRFLKESMTNAGFDKQAEGRDSNNVVDNLPLPPLAYQVPHHHTLKSKEKGKGHVSQETMTSSSQQQQQQQQDEQQQEPSSPSPSSPNPSKFKSFLGRRKASVVEDNRERGRTATITMPSFLESKQEEHVPFTEYCSQLEYCLHLIHLNLLHLKRNHWSINQFDNSELENLVSSFGDSLREILLTSSSKIISDEDVEALEKLKVTAGQSFSTFLPLFLPDINDQLDLAMMVMKNRKDTEDVFEASESTRKALLTHILRQSLATPEGILKIMNSYVNLPSSRDQILKFIVRIIEGLNSETIFHLLPPSLTSFEATLNSSEFEEEQRRMTEDLTSSSLSLTSTMKLNEKKKMKKSKEEQQFVELSKEFCIRLLLQSFMTVANPDTPLNKQHEGDMDVKKAKHQLVTTRRLLVRIILLLIREGTSVVHTSASALEGHLKGKPHELMVIIRQSPIVQTLLIPSIYAMSLFAHDLIISHTILPSLMRLLNEMNHLITSLPFSSFGTMYKAPLYPRSLPINESSRVSAGSTVSSGRWTQVKGFKFVDEPSTNINLTDDDTCYNSQDGSYQAAFANYGLVSGKCAWEMFLEEDTLNSECSYIGATYLPFQGRYYYSMPTAWLVQCYSGEMYCRGTYIGSKKTIRKGSIIRFELDMVEGELTYQVIENEAIPSAIMEEPEKFTQAIEIPDTVENKAIFPFVGTYNMNVKMRLLKFEVSKGSSIVEASDETTVQVKRITSETSQISLMNTLSEEQKHFYEMIRAEDVMTEEFVIPPSEQERKLNSENKDEDDQDDDYIQLTNGPDSISNSMLPKNEEKVKEMEEEEKKTKKERKDIQPDYVTLRTLGGIKSDALGELGTSFTWKFSVEGSSLMEQPCLFGIFWAKNTDTYPSPRKCVDSEKCALTWNSKTGYVYYQGMKVSDDKKIRVPSSVVKKSAKETTVHLTLTLLARDHLSLLITVNGVNIGDLFSIMINDIEEKSVESTSKEEEEEDKEDILKPFKPSKPYKKPFDVFSAFVGNTSFSKNGLVPSILYPVVSIPQAFDKTKLSIRVEPAGFMGKEDVSPIFYNHHVLSSLIGRSAASLVAGPHISSEELLSLVWLRSPLFIAGQHDHESNKDNKHSLCSWEDAWNTTLQGKDFLGEDVFSGDKSFADDEDLSKAILPSDTTSHLGLVDKTSKASKRASRYFVDTSALLASLSSSDEHMDTKKEEQEEQEEQEERKEESLYFGHVSVSVDQASNLKKVAHIHSQDPYIELTLEINGEIVDTCRTPVIVKGERAPVWNLDEKYFFNYQCNSLDVIQDKTNHSQQKGKNTATSQDARQTNNNNNKVRWPTRLRRGSQVTEEVESTESSSSSSDHLSLPDGIVVLKARLFTQGTVKLKEIGYGQIDVVATKRRWLLSKTSKSGSSSSQQENVPVEMMIRPQGTLNLVINHDIFTKEGLVQEIEHEKERKEDASKSKDDQKQIDNNNDKREHNNAAADDDDDTIGKRTEGGLSEAADHFSVFSYGPKEFIEKLSEKESPLAPLLIEWLEDAFSKERGPFKSALMRNGTYSFPRVEYPYLACLIHHLGCKAEAMTIMELLMHDEHEEETPEPSNEMKLVWQRLFQLRTWLRKQAITLKNVDREENEEGEEEKKESSDSTGDTKTSEEQESGYKPLNSYSSLLLSNHVEWRVFNEPHLSRYNDEYICSVYATGIDLDLGLVAIQFCVRGDNSMGPLQDPSLSTVSLSAPSLASCRFSLAFSTHHYDEEDSDSVYGGLLVYKVESAENDESTGDDDDNTSSQLAKDLIDHASSYLLKFTFGSSGYSEVSLGLPVKAKKSKSMITSMFEDDEEEDEEDELYEIHQNHDLVGNKKKVTLPTSSFDRLCSQLASKAYFLLSFKNQKASGVRSHQQRESLSQYNTFSSNNDDDDDESMGIVDTKHEHQDDEDTYNQATTAKDLLRDLMSKIDGDMPLPDVSVVDDAMDTVGELALLRELSHTKDSNDDEHETSNEKDQGNKNKKNQEQRNEANHQQLFPPPPSPALLLQLKRQTSSQLIDRLSKQEAIAQTISLYVTTPTSQLTPKKLAKTIKRRELRAKYRSFGLQALIQLLSLDTFQMLHEELIQNNQSLLQNAKWNGNSLIQSIRIKSKQLKTFKEKSYLWTAMNATLSFVRPALKPFIILPPSPTETSSSSSTAPPSEEEMKEEERIRKRFAVCVKINKAEQKSSLHYLNGLEGCKQLTIHQVQDLYSQLCQITSEFLSPAIAASLMRSSTIGNEAFMSFHSMLSLFTIQFSARDHQLLKDCSIIESFIQGFDGSSYLMSFMDQWEDARAMAHSMKEIDFSLPFSTSALIQKIKHREVLPELALKHLSSSLSTEKLEGYIKSTHGHLLHDLRDISHLTSSVEMSIMSNAVRKTMNQQKEEEKKEAEHQRKIFEKFRRWRQEGIPFLAPFPMINREEKNTILTRLNEKREETISESDYKEHEFDDVITDEKDDLFLHKLAKNASIQDMEGNRLLVRSINTNTGCVFGTVLYDITDPDACEKTGNYFELTVDKDESTSGLVFIGIGLASPTYSIDGQMPGWLGSSYGYHGDDGQKFGVGKTPGTLPTWNVGDVIGCGFVPGSQSIFVTRNGELLETAFNGVDENELQPVIGLTRVSGWKAKVNFGLEPFKYEGEEVIVGSAVLKEREKQEEKKKQEKNEIEYIESKEDREEDIQNEKEEENDDDDDDEENDEARDQFDTDLVPQQMLSELKLLLWSEMCTAEDRIALLSLFGRIANHYSHSLLLTMLLKLISRKGDLTSLADSASEQKQSEKGSDGPLPPEPPSSLLSLTKETSVFGTSVQHAAKDMTSLISSLLTPSIDLVMKVSDRIESGYLPLGGHSKRLLSPIKEESEGEHQEQQEQSIVSSSSSSLENQLLDHLSLLLSFYLHTNHIKQTMTSSISLLMNETTNDILEPMMNIAFDPSSSFPIKNKALSILSIIVPHLTLDRIPLMKEKRTEDERMVSILDVLFDFIQVGYELSFYNEHEEENGNIVRSLHLRTKNEVSEFLSFCSRCGSFLHSLLEHTFWKDDILEHLEEKIQQNESNTIVWLSTLSIMANISPFLTLGQRYYQLSLECSEESSDGSSKGGKKDLSTSDFYKPVTLRSFGSCSSSVATIAPEAKKRSITTPSSSHPTDFLLPLIEEDKSNDGIHFFSCEFDWLDDNVSTPIQEELLNKMLSMFEGKIHAIAEESKGTKGKKEGKMSSSSEAESCMFAFLTQIILILVKESKLSLSADILPSLLSMPSLPSTSDDVHTILSNPLLSLQKLRLQLQNRVESSLSSRQDGNSDEKLDSPFVVRKEVTVWRAKEETEAMSDKEEARRKKEKEVESMLTSDATFYCNMPRWASPITGKTGSSWTTSYPSGPSIFDDETVEEDAEEGLGVFGGLFGDDDDEWEEEEEEKEEEEKKEEEEEEKKEDINVDENQEELESNEEDESLELPPLPGQGDAPSLMRANASSVSVDENEETSSSSSSSSGSSSSSSSSSSESKEEEEEVVVLPTTIGSDGIVFDGSALLDRLLSEGATSSSSSSTYSNDDERRWVEWFGDPSDQKPSSSSSSSSSSSQSATSSSLGFEEYQKPSLIASSSSSASSYVRLARSTFSTLKVLEFGDELIEEETKEETKEGLEKKTIEVDLVRDGTEVWFKETFSTTTLHEESTEKEEEKSPEDDLISFYVRGFITSRHSLLEESTQEESTDANNHTKTVPHVLNIDGMDYLLFEKSHYVNVVVWDGELGCETVVLKSIQSLLLKEPNPSTEQSTLSLINQALILSGSRSLLSETLSTLVEDKSKREETLALIQEFDPSLLLQLSHQSNNYALRNALLQLLPKETIMPSLFSSLRSLLYSTFELPLPESLPYTCKLTIKRNLNEVMNFKVLNEDERYVQYHVWTPRSNIVTTFSDEGKKTEHFVMMGQMISTSSSPPPGILMLSVSEKKEEEQEKKEEKEEEQEKEEEKKNPIVMTSDFRLVNVIRDFSTDGKGDPKLLVFAGVPPSDDYASLGLVYLQAPKLDAINEGYFKSSLASCALPCVLKDILEALPCSSFDITHSFFNGSIHIAEDGLPFVRSQKKEKKEEEKKEENVFGGLFNDDDDEEEKGEKEKGEKEEEKGEKGKGKEKEKKEEEEKFYPTHNFARLPSEPPIALLMNGEWSSERAILDYHATRPDTYQFSLSMCYYLVCQCLEEMSLALRNKTRNSEEQESSISQWPQLMEALVDVVRSPSSINPLPFIQLIQKALTLSTPEMHANFSFNPLIKLSHSIGDKVLSAAKAVGGFENYTPHSSLLPFIDLAILIIRMAGRMDIIEEEKKEEKKEIVPSRIEWWTREEFRSTPLSTLPISSKDEEGLLSPPLNRALSSPEKTKEAIEEKLAFNHAITSFSSFSALEDAMTNVFSLEGKGPTEFLDQLAILSSSCEHLLAVETSQTSTASKKQSKTKKDEDTHLLSKAPLHPTILASIWYHHASAVKTVESSHPYSVPEDVKTTTDKEFILQCAEKDISLVDRKSTFPLYTMVGVSKHDHQLLVIFDDRCSLPSHVRLVIYYTYFKKNGEIVEVVHTYKNKVSKEASATWPKKLTIKSPSFKYKLVYDPEEEEEKKEEREEENHWGFSFLVYANNMDEVSETTMISTPTITEKVLKETPSSLFDEKQDSQEEEEEEEDTKESEQWERTFLQDGTITANILSSELSLSLDSLFMEVKDEEKEESSNSKKIRIRLMLSPTKGWDSDDRFHTSDMEGWGYIDIEEGMEDLVNTMIESNRSFDYKLCLEKPLISSSRRKEDEDLVSKKSESEEDMEKSDETKKVKVFVSLLVKNKLKKGSRFISRLSSSSNPFPSFVRSMHMWTKAMDSALLTYIEDKQKAHLPYFIFSIPSISSDTTQTITFTESRYSSCPDLSVLSNSSLTSHSTLDVQARGVFLCMFNFIAKEALHICDMNIQNTDYSDHVLPAYMKLGEKLIRAHNYLFMTSKESLLKEAISKTQYSGSNNSITLSNFKSLGSRDNGDVNPHVSESCFNQAYEQLSTVSIPSLRNVFGGDRAFNITFEGEGGIDAGGVFREGMSRIMEDLFDPSSLNLLIPCANAKHDAYENRDKFVPNPKWKDDYSLKLFEFVGILMGISIRTNLCLPFEFPPIIWKNLVCEPLTSDDLISFDGGTWKMIDDLMNMDVSELLLAMDDSKENEEENMLSSKEDEDTMKEKEEEMRRFFFEENFEGVLQFMYLTADGDEKELKKGGSSIDVTYDTIDEYVSLLARKKLHEFDIQCEHIRYGLGRIVPSKVINLFSWRQLEVLVCGNPVFDITFWKKHSVNQGLSEKCYEVFWKVMESFTPEQQQGWVRFAWGRSRLPTTDEAFHSSMTLTKAYSGSLPVAHTCFFSVEMPELEDEDEMRKALLTAIEYGVTGILNG